MSLAAAGRREEASELLRDASTLALGERLDSAAAEWIRVNEELAYSTSQTVVESTIAARSRILVANAAAILLTGLLGFLTFLRIVKPIRALDASVRAIAAGRIRQRGSIYARDRRNRRPGALDRSPQTGRGWRWTSSAG